jgi:hypothetical protein
MSENPSTNPADYLPNPEAGLCGDRFDEPRGRLGTDYDALWALWGAYATRPPGHFVGGGLAAPRHVPGAEGGWAWSPDGMPCLMPRRSFAY